MVLFGLCNPVGWSGQDVIDDAKHVVIGTDLFLATWVFLVLLFLGDLVKHLREEQIEAGI